MTNIDWKIVFVLFLIVFGLRFFATAELPSFASDESYFHYKHVSYLVAEGELLHYDPLSFGGREVYYPPFFHIFLSLFGDDIFVLRFIVEVIFALSAVFFYLLSRSLVKRHSVALLGTFFYVTLPVVLDHTLNELSVYSLVLLLFFIVLYSYFHAVHGFYLRVFVVGALLLGLTHASVFLLLLGFLFALFLSAGKDLYVEHVKRELVFVFTLVTFLFLFLVFKQPFLTYGFSIIWQNIPDFYFQEAFGTLEPLALLLQLGFFPLLFGTYGLFVGVFRQHREIVYVFSGLLLSIFLLLGFHLLALDIGLLFFGVFMSLLSVVGIDRFVDSLSRLRVSHRVVLGALFILVFYFTLLPSYDRFTDIPVIDSDVITGAQWLRENSNPHDVVLTSLHESNIIQVIAQRKTLIDNYFLLAPDVHERYTDVGILYRGLTQVKVSQLLDAYSIDYILVSEKTKDFYGVTLDASGYDCYNEVEDVVYEVVC